MKDRSAGTPASASTPGTAGTTGLSEWQELLLIAGLGLVASLSMGLVAGLLWAGGG